MKEIGPDFFKRDASVVAVDLLGKIIQHNYKGVVLKSIIIETESYYIKDKGSHASLGWTEKRDALFSDPGTIYMYYARGKDSLNFSARGDGNAVLIKSGFPLTDDPNSLNLMMKLNPGKDGKKRKINKLCAGQTLLCKSMGFKVKDYDGKKLPLDSIRLFSSEITNHEFIQTLRLGIPEGRDEGLWQRFILKDYVKVCTSNPLTKRGKEKGCFRFFSSIDDIDFKKTASER